MTILNARGRRAATPIAYAISFGLAFTLLLVSFGAPAEEFFSRNVPVPGVQSIVGSWKLVDDVTEDIFFGTYAGGFLEGTVNFSTPDDNMSLTHGLWRRTGPRSFVDTDSAFIYGEDGRASLIITFSAEIEVAESGSTASFAFNYELSQLDGTVIDAGASTATGTRIELAPSVQYRVY